MFYLTYDLGMYDDETVCEEFDTVEELLERYKEIEYEVCEIEAFRMGYRVNWEKEMKKMLKEG